MLLGLLVINEWKVKQPIMPLHLFASRERAGAYTARLLFAGTMIGFFFFTTQFLQGVYGYNPLQAGVAFLPMTIVNFFVALAVPRLTHRFGNATLLAAGLAVTLAGMFWLSRITAGTPYLTGVALPMVLIGIGQGLGFAPLTAAGIAGATAKDAGAASGLVNTSHQLGSALGVGVLVALSANAGSLAGSAAVAYTGGSVMLAAALLAVLVLIVPAERSARRTPGPGPAFRAPQTRPSTGHLRPGSPSLRDAAAHRHQEDPAHDLNRWTVHGPDALPGSSRICSTRASSLYISPGTYNPRPGGWSRLTPAR